MLKHTFSHLACKGSNFFADTQGKSMFFRYMQKKNRTFGAIVSIMRIHIQEKSAIFFGQGVLQMRDIDADLLFEFGK